MLIKTPAEIRLLDKILEELLESYPDNPDSKIIRENVIDKMKGKYYNIENNAKIKISIDKVIGNALTYLNDEKYLEYIIYEGGDNIIVINYKGIVKIAQGGFVGEYRSIKRDKFLQRIFWIAAALSLTLSIYVVAMK